MVTKLGIGQGATRSRLVTWLAQPVREVLRRLCFLVGDVTDTKLREVSHEGKHVLLRLCFLVGDEIDTKLGKVSHEGKHVVKSGINGHKGSAEIIEVLIKEGLCSGQP